MKHLGSSLLLFMWLSIFFLECDAACHPDEEGTTHFFYCRNRPVDATVTLTAGNGTNQRTIAHCSRQGCTDLDPALSISNRTLQENNLTATFEIKSLSRINPFNMETKWGCQSGSHPICDPLPLYAKAAHPVCDIPKYTETTHNEIFLNCKTDRVYPKAVCSYAAMLDDGTVKQLWGPVTYNHRTVSKNPLYYSTECSATFSLSSIPKNLTSFVVDMRPSVARLRDSEFTRLQIPLATPSASLHPDCPNGDVKNGYIKSGTTATCRCMVTTSGYPDGQAQWYTLNGTQVGTRNGLDGSATLTIREPPQTHYCLAESFSGKGDPISFSPKFGSELKLLDPHEKTQTISFSSNGTANLSFQIYGYPPPSEFLLKDVEGSASREVNRSLYSVSYTRLKPSLGRVTVNLGLGLKNGSRHYILTVANDVGDGLSIELRFAGSASAGGPFVSDELIIGLCVGGAVILLIVFFAICVCCCRRCNGDKTSKGRSDGVGSQVHKSHGKVDEKTSGGISFLDLQRETNLGLGYVDPIYVSEHSYSPHTNEHLYDTIQEQYVSPTEMEPYNIIIPKEGPHSL